MRCETCGSETPPQYQQHGLAAWICHTCKALGRIIEAAFSPDAVGIEVPAPAEQATQSEETITKESIEAEPVPDQTDGDTGKRKTKKLKP